MISRIQAMLKHLQRSETSERHYLQEELSDISSIMYKSPLWKERSLRERGLHSIRNEDDLEFWYREIINLPSAHRSLV